MAGKGVRAGKAYLELGLRAKIDKGLQAAARKLRAFGTNAIKFGGGIVASASAALTAVVGPAKRFASIGDDIGKMAKRTGIGAEALQELGFAARQSGTDLGTVENGTKRMQRVINDAANGLAGAQRSLEQIGLSPDQLAGKATEDQLQMVSDALAQVDDSSRQAAIAQEIFGRAGTQLLPLFKEGPKGLAALRAEAKQLGIVLSDEDIANAEMLEDSFGRSGDAIKAVFLKIGAAVAPALSEILDHLSLLAAKANAITEPIKEFFSANTKLTKSIFAVVASVGVAGGVIAAVGSVFAIIGIAIPAIIAGFSAITAIFSAVVGPATLVVLAIAGIGAVIWLYRDTIKQWAMQFWNAIAPIRNAVMQIWDVVKTTFEGIQAAIATGDLQGAVEILWAGIKTAFFTGAASAAEAWYWLLGKAAAIVGKIGSVVRGIFGTTFDWIADALGNVFANFKETFGAIANAIMGGNIGLAADILWASIMVAFVSGTGAIRTLWAGFVLGLKEVWSIATSGIVSIFRSVVSVIASVMSSVLGKFKTVLETIAEYDPTGAAAKVASGLGSVSTLFEIAQQDLSARQKSAEEARNRQQIARGKAHRKDLAKIQADTEAAKDRRNQLIKQAAEEGGEITFASLRDANGLKLGKLVDDAIAESNAAKEKTEEVQDERDDSFSDGRKIAKGKSAGSFSALGAQLLGLGGSNAAEETARNTRSMAATLNRIERRKPGDKDEPNKFGP